MVRCRRCPRLVEWRERVAREKRAAFADEEYWGRPVPGFGDPAAKVYVLGLAPAAHGGNRTGRVFTGDRSGDWLFASMHRTGFANQAHAVARDDGLRLDGAFVAAAVRCAPPANRPLPAERDECLPYAAEELRLLDPAVLLCLGGFAWDAACRLLGLRPRPRGERGLAGTARSPRGERGLAGTARSPRGERGLAGTARSPRFGHAAEVAVEGGPVLLGCYHPSQQNTFTGKLTEPMTDAVFSRARELAYGGSTDAASRR